MKKNIEDYLHFYSGQTVQIDKGEFLFETGRLVGPSFHPRRWVIEFERKLYHVELVDIKLPLRELSSMTRQQALGLCDLKMAPMRVLDILVITEIGVEFKYESFDKEERRHQFFDELSPVQFRLLLKAGFDLFGLKEESFVVEKKQSVK